MSQNINRTVISFAEDPSLIAEYFPKTEAMDDLQANSKCMLRYDKLNDDVMMIS